MFEEGIKFQLMIEKYHKKKLLEEKKKRRQFLDKIHQERIQACKESYVEYEGVLIERIALNELKKMGFEKDFGTKCISEIVEFLFHERKAIDRSLDLYNFDIERNNHYYFLDYGVNNVLENIAESVEKVGLSHISKNDLYYGLLDKVVVVADEEKEKLQKQMKLN